MENKKSNSPENHQKQIVTELLRHIPLDVVSTLFGGKSHAKVEKIVMFIDVSGFTAMTEMYSANARTGIDDLTTELNKYFSIIVEHIENYSGEVIKFAGDAILSCWPHNGGAVRAMECAIDIQQTCSHYMTGSTNDGDQKMSTELNVRIVIARGCAEIIIITTPLFSHYFLLGPAVDQIKQIEHESEIRTVVVSREFWDILPLSWQQHLRAHKLFENDTFVKIGYTVSKPKQSKRFHAAIQKGEIKISDSLATALSKFVIGPVYEKIANLEPLNYVSEMRYISICFINIDLKHLQGENLRATIDEIFVHVNTVSQTYDGLLSKVIGFDKGLSFLCLFGLAATENNPCASALDAAEELKIWLSSLDHGIDRVSVGVATGLTYCGVVGHSERHEYTSIGTKVNLSARLMCYYPGIVSCDRETAVMSRLPKCYFKQLPPKAMKGFKGNVPAFEYSKMECNKTTYFQSEIDKNHQECECLSLYGRRIEIMMVCSKITAMLDREQPMERNYGLVFRGEDGSGRTTLLRHIFDTLKEGCEGVEVMFIRCLPERINIEANLGYSGLRMVLGSMMHLEEMDNEQRKELYNTLCQLSKSNISRYILADWLEVSRTTDVDDTIDNIAHDKEAFMDIINIVMAYLEPKRYILLIDDLHHLDSESLRVITYISHPPRSILIGAGRLGDKLLEMCASDSDFHVDFKTLLSIKEVQMKELICKMFKVQSIEKGLLKVLHQRTRGLPGLCLEAVVELRRSSMVDIRDLPNVADILQVTTQPTSVANRRNLLVDLFHERCVPNPLDKAVRDLYCSNGDPSKLDMPTSIEAAFMRQYDRLSAFQKSLLNNCSIMGSSFSKEYLFGTCRGDLSKHTFSLAIKVLFENQMLICAYNCEQTISTQIKCCCPGNCTGLPFFCKMFRFYHESIRSIIVSSMTKQTLKYRRINALEWLEAQLPDSIDSSVKWAMCAMEGGTEIMLEESCLTQSSLHKKPSLIGLVNLVKIKSYERSMVVEDTAQDALVDNPAKLNNHLESKPCPSSKWCIVKQSIMSGVIACPFQEIHSSYIKMLNGSKIAIRPVEIFECWNFVDEQCKVYCSPINKILYTRRNSDCPEINKRRSSRHSLRGYEKGITEIKMEKSFSFSSSPAHCNCNSQLRTILNEILKLSLEIKDANRGFYYSLELALLLIKNFRPLSARNVLTNAEQSSKEISPALKSYLYYVKAKYEFCISHDFAKAIEHLHMALSFVSECKNDNRRHLENSHVCRIKKDNASSHFAKAILILMYRIASTDCANTIPNRNQLIRKVAERLEILSRTSARPDNIQVILILAEECYKDTLASRPDDSAKLTNLENHNDYCVECKDMFNYFQCILRQVTMNSLDMISAVIYACLNYVCLEFCSNIKEAFSYAKIAFNIFLSAELIEHLALLLPYVCITCVAVDEVNFLFDKLNEFKRVLNDCYLSENDLRRSMFSALYNALKIDHNDCYHKAAVDFPIGGDMTVIGKHLLLLYHEIYSNEDHFYFMRFRPSSILYCLSAVSKAFSSRGDVNNALVFMKLAFRMIESEAGRFCVRDPLVQRSLLLLCESQLISIWRSEYKNGLKTTFILSMHCIGRRSLNYPMYCILRAFEDYLTNPGASPSADCKSWSKRAVHAAIQLNSKAELGRIYEFAAQYGFPCGIKKPSTHSQS